MKIDVKFSESTSEFPAFLGEAIEIKNGYSQDEVDKLVGDAAEQSYEKGHTEGYKLGSSDGYEDGLAKGIAEGKQEEYDRFWDAFQLNGTRTDYTNAFCGDGWNDVTYAPKYIICPEEADYLFNMTGVSVVDKTTTDFSNTTDLYQGFGGDNGDRGCEIVHISIPKVKSLGALFTRNIRLKKVILENVTEDCQFAVNTFSGCTNLKEVNIYGTIGNGTVSFQWSRISVESMKNIISSLKSFAGTGEENTCTLKFSTFNWNDLEASGAAPNGGTWKDYVSQVLCWNV